jgi:hypothetical protein
MSGPSRVTCIGEVKPRREVSRAVDGSEERHGSWSIGVRVRLLRDTSPGSVSICLVGIDLTARQLVHCLIEDFEGSGHFEPNRCGRT